MGTLRIKRGTKTALQTTPGYTPLEGELVYTTDSKEVFVGDGTTVGGTPVSVSTQNLEDLGNVQALAAQNDQILVYNGSNWAATDNPALDVRGNIFGDDSTLLVDAINNKIVGPIETTSITSTGNIVGDLIGDVTGSVTGNVVGDTTGTHFGNVQGILTGDMTGSIFADDSTVLVDAIAGEIVGRINSPVFVADVILEKEGGGRTKLTMQSKDLASLSGTFGNIDFLGTDINNTTVRGSRFFGGAAGHFFMHDATGVLDSHPENRTISLTDSGIAYGKYAATAKLDIVGDAKISGGLQSDLKTTADALMINATTGEIEVANIDLKGVTGNTPSSASVDSYLEVKVNGATKYIALYA